MLLLDYFLDHNFFCPILPSSACQCRCYRCGCGCTDIYSLYFVLENCTKLLPFLRFSSVPYIYFFHVYVCVCITTIIKKRISKNARNSVHDSYSFVTLGLLVICVQIITWQSVGCCYCCCCLSFFHHSCLCQLLFSVGLYFFSKNFIAPSFSCDLSMILVANCTLLPIIWNINTILFLLLSL